MNLHAIIPAGGLGRRLWPESTSQTPKFLLPLGAADDSGTTPTLAQRTARRLLPIADSLTFITGKQHESTLNQQVKAAVGKVPVSIVVEPSPRDSMAAIGLGAAVLEQRYGSCVMGSFAADHLIQDTDVFQTCVKKSDSRCCCRVHGNYWDHSDRGI